MAILEDPHSSHPEQQKVLLVQVSWKEMWPRRRTCDIADSLWNPTRVQFKQPYCTSNSLALMQSIAARVASWLNDPPISATRIKGKVNSFHLTMQKQNAEIHGINLVACPVKDCLFRRFVWAMPHAWGVKTSMVLCLHCCGTDAAHKQVYLYIQ